MKPTTMRILLLACLLAVTQLVMAQDYAKDYAAIQAQAEEGKFRSALETAEALFQRAARAGDEDDMLKALAYRAAYTYQLEEDGHDATLRLLRTELAANRNRPVVAPVLHFLVGKGYYTYAQQNAYRLRNATATERDSIPPADAPLEDWNLQQLKDAAEEHLLTALERAGRQRTDLGSIPAVVSGDEAGYALRPTLYDLLVYEALGLLGSPLLTVGDVEPAEPERFLVPATDFVALDLSALDPEAGSTRRLKIFQDLLRYHITASLKDRRALLHADHNRIAAVRQWVSDPEALRTTYERMYLAYAGVPGHGQAAVELSELYVGSGDAFGPRPLAEALRILDEIKDADPLVRRNVAAQRASILRQQLNVQAREVYPAGENLLFLLSYRNVERVYHRVIRLEDFEAVDRYRGNAETMADYLGRPVVARRDFRLPENDDYADHTTETWLKSLPPGRYALLTSNDGDFDREKGIVAVTDFQVTGLAVINHGAQGEEFYTVTDRTTGAPRPGLKVTVYRSQERRNDSWTRSTTLTTDTQGRFDRPVQNRVQLRFVVEDPDSDDRFVSEPFYSYRNDREDRQRSYPFTPLFTDRAIYRPGQTVHLYGITGRKDGRDMPQLLTDETRELTLYDANGQEIDKATVTSDAYSRFSHSFTLPEGGLTGSFYVSTDGGSINFRVEEYKRPRFKVELEAPDYAVAGDTAEFTGTATLFAGPGLDDAKVTYRVFREEVRWFWWGRGGGGGDRELVASGETTTGDDGSFTVSFVPADNLARSRFRYVVETDVADATGETHPASASVSLRSEKPVVSLAPRRELLDVTDTLNIVAAGDGENLTVNYRISPVEKPDATLRPRPWAFPDRPVLETEDYRDHFPGAATSGSKPLAEWTAAAPVATGRLTLTDGEGTATVDLSGYPAGHYRIDWTYPDGTAGEPSNFAVYHSERAKLPPGMLYHLEGGEDKLTEGEPVSLRLISALPLPLVHYAFGSRAGETHETTAATNTATFTFTPSADDRGGIGFQLHFVRLAQLHQESRRLAFGWENKQLQIDYATFRDKLRPGVPERWTLTVRNADGSPVSAAALASMYDASLDQIYAGGNWAFSPFPAYRGLWARQNLLGNGSQYAYGRTSRRTERENIPGYSLPSLDLGPFAWYNSRPSPVMMRAQMAGAERRSRMSAAPPPPPPSGAPAEYDAAITEEAEVLADEVAVAGGVQNGPGSAKQQAEAPADAPVPVRTNLQETAFWFPELTTNAAGELTLSFDTPEALTSWKFRLFAHDQELNAAVSERTVATQKELMVLPNVPRFLREGDALELTARVNNLSEQGLVAKASVEFFDPATNEVLELAAAAGAKYCQSEQRIEAGKGTTFCFPLDVPEGLSQQGAVGYRIVVRGGEFSDGEENVIPILTDRTLITVTQPFYLKRKGKKTITLAGLENNDSESLRHVSYTFQATTQPAWIALKSLPYLIEYPYDCTEQIVNRYFANQLAYTTVSSKPILEEVFRQWQADPTALQSELRKNEKLKNALLTETPWVREAQSEEEQRARIANLFDLKQLAKEQAGNLDKLARRQESNGAFAWFPGGRDNRYVTQYVVESLSRLRQLGAVSAGQEATVANVSERAVRYLDGELAEEYRELLRRMKDTNKDWRKDYRPSSAVVHYLYARAFSGTDVKMDAATREAYTFFTERAAAGWLDYGLYEQALLAATSAREGTGLAKTIVTSLRERAIRKDEFGMYWKYGRGYRWSNLPIETHCRILEAFRLAGGTTDELDEMRLWLLTNKRTNRWPTTKATAAAVFALLQTGTDWTTEQDPDELSVSWPDYAASSDLRTRVRAAQNGAEAKTGAFSVNLSGEEVTAGLGTVQVKNKGNELVWGGVFWQYTELAQKVEAANDGPLTLERELFLRRATDDGMRLVPITDATPLTAGDRVTVRLIVRSDRDLDFVHLKDRRAATFEPVEQLSGYRYTNGLGYYQAPGDLATNFFLDRLPRGTYTLEYDLFATFSGTFSNGLGRVQCMYAPEFGANSGGQRVKVE